jgi:hypothetical protein
MQPCLSSLMILVLTGFLTLPTAWADKVTLNDGSVIMGTVTKMVDGKIHIKTNFAGNITISATEVSGVETQETMPVHLSDGSIIHGTVKISDEGGIEVIRTEGDIKIPVQPENISAIAPPKPEPPKWHGNIIGNLAITDGNSENKGFGISMDFAKRAENDRIGIRGGYFYSSTQGVGTRDDQYLTAKYDYFFNQKLFGYMNTRLDRDSIKDLELRTTAGTGAGYQILEDDTYTLSGEAGLSFVNETYANSIDDETYLAGRASASFIWWIVEDKLQFEEIAEILLSLDDRDDWIGISDSAITWKFNSRWSSQAAVRFEYDNTPATGQKETDTKYSVGIGYSF